jgi:hypothetical protein
MIFIDPRLLQVSGDERLGLLMGPATYEFLWAMHPEIRPDTKAFCKVRKASCTARKD